MKRKIIIIGPTYPYRGGNSLFVTFLHDILSKEYDVTIFNYKLLYPDFLFPGKTQYDLSDEVKKIESIRIVNSINPFNWFIVARRLNSINPDLIIFDWWHPFFAFCHFTISFFLRKRLKKKVVFITENIVSHEKNFFENVLTKIGLFNAKYFITLSQKVESELKKFAKARSIYRSELPVYNHLKGDENQRDEIRRKFNFEDDEKVILFFGYVRKYKGLDLLIQSLKILQQSDTSRKYKLLIAGEFYENRENYLSLIENLDLTDKVIIYDSYIPNERVKEFFVASDLVVLPYRGATQSGILNLAYGFGKPVVVTNVGGLSEFVIAEKTGIIANEPTPESLSQAIVQFFNLTPKVNFEKNIDEYCRKNSFHSFTNIVKEIIETVQK
jgi:glycosyltransferase involved in cell wall biosynthesis